MRARPTHVSFLVASLSLAALGCFAAALAGCGGDPHPGYLAPPDPGADAAAETSSDAASDAARDATDATDAATDGSVATLQWTKWAPPTIWTKLLSTVAVDAKDDVFVTDGAAVFMVDKTGTPSVYLNNTELKAAVAGSSAAMQVRYLDVDLAGKLYLLVEGFPDTVYVSSGPHLIASYAPLTARVFTAAITVVSPDRLLGIDRGGLYEITPTALTNVYAQATAGNGDNSPLVARRDGYAYLAPGCNLCDLNGGKSDGTGIGVVLRNDDVYQSIGKTHFLNFTGIARDQTGDGVYVAAEEMVVHLGSDGSWKPVPTNPTLGQLGRSEMLTFGFNQAAIGAGATGTLYVVTTTEGTIYRAALK